MSQLRGFEDRSSLMLESSPFVHMLEEDLHLGIMPIGGRGTEQFDVRLAPASPDVSTLVSSAFSTHDSYGSDDLCQSVCNIVEEVAQVVGSYGRAFYEIVYYYNDDEKPAAFSLEYIPTPTVRRIFGR